MDLDMALKAFREIGDRRNEAMMLNNTGYLRRRQGRMDEAEDYHLRSLEAKLANAHLDQMDMEAAAPLVGALSGQPSNVRSLEVQARFAFLRDDAEAAVRLMSEARTLAGEHWADESETALQKYQEK